MVINFRRLLVFVSNGILGDSNGVNGVVFYPSVKMAVTWIGWCFIYCYRLGPRGNSLYMLVYVGLLLYLLTKTYPWQQHNKPSH